MRFRRPAETEPSDPLLPEEAPSPKRIDAEGVWYAALALVAALVVFAGVVATASISPRFCGLCHRGATAELGQSAHAGTSCDSCHLESGAMGIVENRLGVVSMVFRAPFTLFSGPRVPGAPLDNQSCLDCHADLEAGVVEIGGIKMSHRAPIEAHWFCVDCHFGSAHPTEAFSGTSYSMEKCLQCHSAGTNNLASCGTCHAEGAERVERPTTAWQVTHGANWQRSHGMGDLTTCKTCHGPTYCVACHNIPLPHAANFMASHGAVVVASPALKVDCNVCHQQSTCDNCHGMDMPHPNDFARVHKDEIDALGKDLCLRCHAEESCDSCHVRHTHPGIPLEQLKRLQREPVSPR